jgi:hypothetical protein
LFIYSSVIILCKHSQINSQSQHQNIYIRERVILNCANWSSAFWNLSFDFKIIRSLLPYFEWLHTTE